jgi:hypothetical protein
MSPSDNRRDPDSERGYGRAEAYLEGPDDKQVDVKRLLHRIANVLSVDHYGDELVRMRIAGAHDAGLQILVVIDTDGRIGWALR